MEGANKIPGTEAPQIERRFEQIVGHSSALESVLAEVERVAPTNSTVLILGETGTGKELIARAAHNISARCGRPFVKLNSLQSLLIYWKANCLDTRKALLPEPSRKR